MYKRNPRKQETAVLYGSLQEAAARYGIGGTLLKEKAKEVNALVKIGRRVLVSYEIMDEYFRTLAKTGR